MLCSIGGHIPREPVVNRRTGALYEKNLILRYLAETGPRDPVTNEPLNQSDLLTVHGGAPNAAPGIARLMQNNNNNNSNNSTSSSVGGLAANVTSVPGLLSMLQVEWEALTLEQFSLRQQLATAQQELSLALYKHDAACRVIANLVKERDAALAGRGGAAVSKDNSNMTSALVSALDKNANSNSQDAAQQLINQQHSVPARIAAELEANSEQRKATLTGFEVPPGTAASSQIAEMVEYDNFIPAHAGGVQSCATLDVHGNRFLFTGGTDGKVFCYDVGSRTVHTSMLGHSKPVTRIFAKDNRCITTSDDGTGRVWIEDTGAYRTGCTFQHPRGISDFTVLPTNAIKYGVTSGNDGCMRLHDLETGVTIADGGAQNNSRQQQGGLSAVTAHPYGLMTGTGSGNTVHLWDVRTMEVDVSFAINAGGAGNATNVDAAAATTTNNNPASANVGQISSLCFNINGRTLAVGTGLGIVQLWDLRKLAAPMSTIQWDASSASQCLKARISRVSFDQSGQFLAVAADQVRIWSLKGKHALGDFRSHIAAPTDVCWGLGANWLATCSAGEKNVKVWQYAA